MSGASAASAGSAEADSEIEGHPSDVLIVAKAATRRRKRDYELLQAVGTDSDSKEAASAAKKARKAAKRVSKAFAAAATDAPTGLGSAADSGNGTSKLAKSPVFTTADRVATSVAETASKRAAKAKSLTALLSPENAKPAIKTNKGAEDGVTAAVAPAPNGAKHKTNGTTLLSLDAQEQAGNLATRTPTAFPAFRTTAAADETALAVTSRSAATPMASNLPDSNSSVAHPPGGILLSVLMQQLRSSPLLSPLPRLGSKASDKTDRSPGSDSTLTTLGISLPRRPLISGIGSGERTSVRSRLGGGVASRPRQPGEAPAGVTVIEDDAVPAVNSEVKRLLRAPRYFDDEFVDSAMLCYRCGGTGHKAFDCTNEAKARPCALCAQFGHSKANCPSLVCFKCNRNGHISRDCPNAGNRVNSETSAVCLRCGSASCPGVADYVRAGGGCTGRYSRADVAQTRCYICRRLGHVCCEDAPTTSWRPTCHNCGEGGHMGTDCTRPVPPAVRNERTPQCRPSTGGVGGGMYDPGGYEGGYGGGGSASVECYSCGEYGHMSRDCPNGSRYGGHGGGGGGGGGGGACFTCGSFEHIARNCPQKAYAPKGNYGGGYRASSYVGHSGGGNEWGGRTNNWQSQSR